MKVAGGVVALALVAAVRLLSFVPYTVERDTGSIVRLAWRARGVQVRDCRRLTPDELAKLPPHMRQEEVCQGRLIPYRLVVTLDGARLVDRLVRGAGARQDRPLYVFEDLGVRPGSHRVAVEFTPQGQPEAERKEGEEDRPTRRTTPPRLTLDTTLVLAPRRVALVTYEEEREQLVVRGGSQP